MPIDLPPIPHIEQKYEKTKSGILKPKKNTFFPGMGGPLAGAFLGTGLIPELFYLGTVNNAGNGSTYNFTSRPLGDPHPSRLIIVAAHADADSSISINSCTIAGVAGTVAISAKHVYEATVIYYANVATGTTGTITVTTSGTTACAIGVYAAYYLESFTPVGTNSNAGSTNMTLSASSLENGIGIGSSQAGNFDTFPYSTWGSPMTERYDYGIDNEYYVVASSASVAEIPGTTLSFSLNRSIGIDYACAALATWR